MSRRWMCTSRVVILASIALCAGAATIAACGDEVQPAPTPTPIDSGFGVDGATTNDSSAPRPDGSVTDPDANVVEDAGTDATTSYDYTTCKTLKEATPSLASGVYDIDLDNDGPLPKLSVYCDMTFDDGGWTLIESFNGTNTTNGLAPATGPDGGYLAASPRPGALGGLAGWVTKELAAKSAQVHVRYSFAKDAGAANPDGGLWITSRTLEDGGVTMPMHNLRNLDTMSKGTDGGFGDWTGPRANALTLSWKPFEYNCLSLTSTRKYPDVLWSCGNFESLNVIHERVSFRWNDGTQQPIEVYVR